MEAYAFCKVIYSDVFGYCYNNFIMHSFFSGTHAKMTDNNEEHSNWYWEYMLVNEHYNFMEGLTLFYSTLS